MQCFKTGFCGPPVVLNAMGWMHRCIYTVSLFSNRNHFVFCLMAHNSVYSDHFVTLQSTISIHNSNFFEAHLDNFNIEVNWEDYVVANPDIPGSVRVKPRSTLNVCACKTNG